MLCCRGVDTKAKTGGLAVTLIDFTLSRVTMPGGAVAFCDLSADPELFAGPKGGCQVWRFPFLVTCTASCGCIRGPSNIYWPLCRVYVMKTSNCKHVRLQSQV